MKFRKINKVLIFTLLVLSAIIFSSFNKSYSKYMKDEVSLNYDLTLSQLTKQLTYGTDYSYSVVADKSTADNMVLNFWFKPTGYVEINKETYTLSATNCSITSSSISSDKLNYTFSCNPSAMYISNVYTTTITINDQIEGDYTGFKYSSVVVSINENDYNYQEEPKLDPTTDGNSFKMPKNYTSTTTSYNSALETLFNNYASTTADYSDQTIKLKKYFEAYYSISGDNAKTTCINGFTCTSDDNYYIYTIDKSIISYARTYNEMVNNTGYVYLDNITNPIDIMKYALSYYYTDTTEYNDILSYIDSDDDGDYDELNELIAGTLSIGGFKYNSSSNSIKIDLSYLLLYVYPSSPFEFSVTFTENDVLSYNNIKTQLKAKYSTAFGTFLSKLTDLKAELKTNTTYDNIYYYQDEGYLLEVKHTTDDDKIYVTVSEVNALNNVYTLEDVVEGTSSVTNLDKLVTTDITYWFYNATYTKTTSGTTTTITLTIS